MDNSFLAKGAREKLVWIGPMATGGLYVFYHWTLPKRAKFVMFTAIGGGGGGGGGKSGSAGTNRNGGGGGGSGSCSTLLLPAIFCPPEITVMVYGRNAGGGTDADGTAGNAALFREKFTSLSICYAVGGALGRSATNGGAGGAGATPSNLPRIGGLLSDVIGIAGGAGGIAGAAPGDSNGGYGTLSGGGGGAGISTSNASVNGGYAGFNLKYPYCKTASNGGTSTLQPVAGMLSEVATLQYSGGGGGASINGTGQTGADGGIGCGGGGGGAGTTGGGGGIGGPGICIIQWW